MPFFLQPHQTERESVWGGKIGRGGTDHPGGTKGPPQEGAVRNETAAGGVISKNGAGGSGGARERPFFAGRRDRPPSPSKAPGRPEERNYVQNSQGQGERGAGAREGRGGGGEGRLGRGPPPLLREEEGGTEAFQSLWGTKLCPFFCKAGGGRGGRML